MAWTRTSGQTDQVGFNASGTSQAVTLPQAVVVGHIIMVSTRYDNTVGGTAPDTMTVSDGLGNTYTKVHNAIITDEHRINHWLAPVTTGGSAVITMSTSSSATSLTIMAMEYTPNSGSGGTLDQIKSATGTSTAGNSGSTSTTTAAEELLFATVSHTNNGGNQTAGSSFTKRLESSNAQGRMAMFDRIVSATGAYAITSTLAAGSYTWLAMITTIKDSGGGAAATSRIVALNLPRFVTPRRRAI